MLEAMVDDVMRRDWDQRARENPLYYIVTDSAESEEQFAHSGEVNIRDILADVSEMLPATEAVLEIGSGNGRLLRPLAPLFQQVYGVDVSPVMTKLAEQRLADLHNVKVWANNGSDLEPMASDKLDFVFSYLVFQHIPHEAVVANYISEAFRVLKSGGIFKFQAAGREDTLTANLTESLRQKTTWVGVNFTDREIRSLVEKAGFRVKTTYTLHPPDSCIFLWVIAEKP